MSELTFSVPGMTCGHCKMSVEGEVGKVAGVASVAVDLDTKLVTVGGDALDRAAIVAAIEGDGADAVVTTGGTGIAPRDQTYEAVDALLEKRLDGFGEAFRRLSWDEVGPRAILSRAVAGTRGRAVLVALPGSVKGVRLAVTQVLGPVLPHMVALLRS